MEKPVKVSVIMLAYNIAPYIETAIRGVLLQETTFPVQLVIGEDCSNDGTREICQRYKQQYGDRILLLEHEKNMGLQRNTIDTHSHCTGEYIAICDGDDYWTDKHKLQKMADFMDTHPDYAICFHRMINYYEEDGSKSFSNGGQKTVTDITDLAKSNYITNSASFFRRRYIPVMPPWIAEIPMCDYVIHMLNSQHGKIYYFKKCMGVYMKHKTGIWSVTGKEKQMQLGKTAREKLMDYFKDRPEVYNGLFTSYAAICKVLIQIYRDSGQAECEKGVVNQLLHYNQQWNASDVERLMTTPTLNKRAGIKGGLLSLAKQMRRILSRLIPLPHV